MFAVINYLKSGLFSFRKPDFIGEYNDVSIILYVCPNMKLIVCVCVCDWEFLRLFGNLKLL